MIPGSEVKKLETYLINKQLRTAKAWYEQAIAQYTDPASSIWLSYNSGALYWGEIGNGEKARHYFIKTWDLFKQYPQFGDYPANACENLMLLSLSIDEFDSWRERLSGFQPDNEILRVLVSHVEKLFDRGHNWGTILSAVMAGPHVKPEPDSSGGNYASGAAILQLVLQNQQNYGLSFEEWQNAIVAYTGAILALVSNCGQTLHKHTGFADPNELIFIVEDALPYAQEFAATYPKDEWGRKCVANLENAIREANQVRVPHQANSLRKSAVIGAALPPISRAVECAECNSGMGLVAGAHTKAISAGQVRGALQCTHCQRVYCLECSDTALACYCGSHDCPSVEKEKA